jgi:drug/metabolite transporter (DMT)-like permease
MARKKVNLNWKILGFIILVDGLETITHFCFKKSVLPESGLEIMGFAALFGFFKAVLFSPYLWLGLASVLLTFIIWSGILSKIDLSVAVPVCSFSHISIPVVAMIFLHERISLLRWGGIAMILAGVILVSLSSRHKEEASG